MIKKFGKTQALLLVLLFSCSWAFFFFSGLDLNPYYGDDIREISIARETPITELIFNLVNPFPKDLLSWLHGSTDRAFHFLINFKIASWLNYKYQITYLYSLKIASVTVLALLSFLIMYELTASLFFSIICAVFVVTNHILFYASLWIADSYIFSEALFAASLLLLSKTISRPNKQFRFFLLYVIAAYLAIKSKANAKINILILPLFYLVFNKQIRIKKSFILFFILLSTTAIPLENIIHGHFLAGGARSMKVIIH